MNITAKVALRMIPDSLATQPIFLCVDDTMVAKAGTRFENVSKLFDHAAHNGSNYLNGHCFVSIMLCIPVWKNDRMKYIPLFLYSFRWNIETRLHLFEAVNARYQRCGHVSVLTGYVSANRHKV